MEDYEKQRLLGQGVYGRVHTYRHKNTNQLVAIKTIDLASLRKSNQNASVALDKAKTMLKLKGFIHPHVATILGTVPAGNSYHVIFEYCETGGLHNVIDDRSRRKTPLTDAEVTGCLYQMASGLDFIHHMKLVHRNLKPSNVLVTTDGTLKLTDVGLLTASSSGQAGSLRYTAPEVIDRLKAGIRSDIWSLGAMLYELATLAPPFIDDSQDNLITKFKSASFDPLDASRSNDLRDLVDRMLSVDPRRRPACGEILQMEFVFRCAEARLDLAAHSRAPSKAPLSDIGALLDACRNGELETVLERLAVLQGDADATTLKQDDADRDDTASPAAAAETGVLDARKMEKLMETVGGMDDIYVFCQRLIDGDGTFPSSLLQSLHAEVQSTCTTGTNSVSWPLDRLLKYAVDFIRLLCEVQCPRVRGCSFDDALLLCCHVADESERHDMEADLLCVRLHYETDLECFKAAASTAERLKEKLSKVTNAALLSECCAVLGWHYVTADRVELAMRMCQRAIDALPPTVPSRKLVDVLRTCGRINYFGGRLEMSKLLLAQAAAIVNSGVMVRCDFKWAQILEDMDTYLGRAGFCVEAVEACRDRLAMFERLLGRSNARTAMALCNLASAVLARERATGGFEEAVGLVDEAIGVYERIGGCGVVWSALYVKAQVVTAMADREEDGNEKKRLLDETMQLWKRIVDVTRRVYGEETVVTASGYINLACVSFRLRLYKQGEEMMGRAMAVLQKLASSCDDLSSLSTLCNDLAGLYLCTKEYDEVEKLLTRAIDIHNRHSATSTLNLESVYSHFISNYNATGQEQKVQQYTAAIHEYRKTISTEKSSQKNLPIGNEPVMSVKELKSQVHCLLAGV